MVAHGGILNRNLNFITSEPTFDQVSLNFHRTTIW